MSTTLKHSGADRPPLALLVDVDADTRHMYGDFLRSQAYEIVEAQDGRQALAHAITQHPDVIVSETRLPGMSGLDLCRLLRDDPTTADIPFVFVTADAFEADLQRARAAGADVVLPKPCLPDALALAIVDIRARSRELRQRSSHLQQKVRDQIRDSAEHMGEARRRTNRVACNRSYHRHQTTTPPVSPADLVCPACDQSLIYVKTYVGGVSAKHAEQWDYFECPQGCGQFQYRRRTKNLRRIPQIP